MLLTLRLLYPIPGCPIYDWTGPGANAADWIINVVVLPAWNFLYNFGMQAFGSLWNVAGIQGGVIAQGLCCVIPAILAIVFAVRWAIWGRR